MTQVPYVMYYTAPHSNGTSQLEKRFIIDELFAIVFAFFRYSQFNQQSARYIYAIVSFYLIILYPCSFLCLLELSWIKQCRGRAGQSRASNAGIEKVMQGEWYEARKSQVFEGGMYDTIMLSWYVRRELKM